MPRVSGGRRQQQSSPSGLAVATQVVGLLAGLVTFIYVIGGVVLALRLLFDSFSIDSVVSVVGQLPRESVIATALIDAIGPAFLVGLIGASLYGAAFSLNWKMSWLRSKKRWVRRPVDFGVPVLLMLPATIVVIAQEDGFEPSHTALLVGYGIVLATTFIGRDLLRIIKNSEPQRRVRQHYPDVEPDRLRRTFLVGLIAMCIGITPAVMVAGAIPFDQARVCLADDPGNPVTGPVVADTKDRVLLVDETDDGEAIFSVPSSRVSQLEYGDKAVIEKRDCPVPAPD